MQRLFLVRHGETVDNVAGLYAGVRDSPLTAHGVLQARRLGSHLATRSAAIPVPITNVFSSDLQRAVNTAQAVVDALATEGQGSATPPNDPLALVQVADLRERDFGLAEGKRFGTPHADAETHEQMRTRADRFVRTHLVPLLLGGTGSVLVVSHGLLLNALLRVLLTRFGPGEMAKLAGQGGPRSEYVASWSNTGYMEMVVRTAPAVPGPIVGEGSGRSGTVGQRLKIVLVVLQVNSVGHLSGLKKTRGGIGSAQFDNRQRTMDSFLVPTAKKRKAE